MIRTIVFDMDGTLIDSEALILDAWKEIAAQNQIADIEQTLIKCIGINTKETKAVFRQTYGNDFPYEKYSKMASALYRAEIDKNGLPVKPGVYELFAWLKENHFQIGLASSTREEVVSCFFATVG